MNYSEALKYIYDHLPMFQRVGKEAFKKDLTNIRKLCEHLSFPQKSIKTIHIAGTNGKGSVSHLLSALFQAHGFKTGLYTSPHYKDFRERIKVNGKIIEKKYVRLFVEKNIEFLENLQPSFFEMSFGMALDYFRNQQVDIAIIETGLGGRLDSTNIINPQLSVITNISWDHMDMLGDTLEKIAVEKAGIIKDCADVIIGKRQSETESIFKNKAKDQGVSIFFAGDQKEFLKEYQKTFDFIPDLQGPYQVENIQTALAAFHHYCKVHHVKINQNSVIEAVQRTSSFTGFMGRWRFVAGHYDLLFDSAHNEGGINVLVQWLNEQSYDRVHLICGFVKDKSLNKVLQILPQNASYYFCQAKIPRALDSVLLRDQAQSLGRMGKAYKTVRGAYRAALKQAKKNDLVLVTGSIFVVAEVL